MSRSLDEYMESASQSLVDMDYLSCEAKCLGALALARQAEDWAIYHRILLPLQECRRQRRMIAAEGFLRLGSSTLAGAPVAILDQWDAGCLVLTHPHGAAEYLAVAQAARSRIKHIEVLLADNPATADIWTLIAATSPTLRVDVPAPPLAWRDRELSSAGREANDPQRTAALSAGDWFIDATEQLGDAALAQVDAPLGSVERITQLEACLLIVSDHEILHQRLWEAARALQVGSTA